MLIPPQLLKLAVAASVVLLSTCGNRDSIDKAVEEYIINEYGARGIDRLVVGEGDAQNVYAKVFFRDAAGRAVRINVLVIKNGDWKVVQETR